MTLNLFEMFAGYGGLSTAIENVLGARTTAVAEIEPGPSRILAHHYPHAPNLGDVTLAEWSDTGEVHVIGGGSPCQNISLAGKRRGMLHGTRSGLWASMRDAIAYHRPEFVVWENVRAATTAKASSAHDPNGTLGNLRALGRVLGDLAELGYNAEWTLARASDVGACHQRARIFLLAWDAMARPVRDWADPSQQPFAWWNQTADAFKMRGEIYRDKLPVSGALHNGALYRRAHKSVAPPRAPKLLPTPTVGSTSPAAHGQISGDFRKRWDQALEAWGEYLPGIVHHAATLEMHDVPDPTMPGHREGSRRRLNPAFAEWMMGIPAGHVTNPALGLTRQQQLTAIGNGVMTQQAQWALTELYHRAAGVNGLH